MRADHEEAEKLSDSIVSVPEHDRSNEDASVLAEAYLDALARSEAQRKALEAHAAWSWAEKNHLGTFNQRMELCSYSEHLTERALYDGAEEYVGVPHMIVSPFVGLQRAEADEAQAIVDAMIANYRAARLQAPKAPSPSQGGQP